MATRETMLKQINRQIREYSRRLGTESEEYQNLIANLHSLLGGTPLQNAAGLPMYTASKGRSYDINALMQAYGLVTGKNTASNLEQPYLRKLLEMGEDLTAKNVRRLTEIQRQANENQEALYKLAKSGEFGEPADMKNAWYDFGANRMSGKMGITDVLEKMGAGTLQEMEDMLAKARLQSYLKKKKVLNRAARTKRGRVKAP